MIRQYAFQSRKRCFHREGGVVAMSPVKCVECRAEAPRRLLAALLSGLVKRRSGLLVAEDDSRASVGTEKEARAGILLLEECAVELEGLVRGRIQHRAAEKAIGNRDR